MKNAFIVRDRYLIPPLAAPAADCVLLGDSLSAATRRRLEACGLSVTYVESLEEAVSRGKHCPGGALITYDSVAFSRSVVRRLLAAAARDRRAVLAAALPDGLATRRLSHLGGATEVTVDGQQAFTAPLWALRAGATTTAEALADAAPVVLPYREVVWKLPVPVGMLGTSEEPFGATDTYLTRIDHWAQVLRLNLTALGALWFERWQTVGGKLWFLRRALRGIPWRRGRVPARLNVVHRGAKIHYTAHVELTVVEAGARIGANAVVRNSYIGHGAHIDDGAVVSASVISAHAAVASSSNVFASVLFSGAFAAQQKMQFSVLAPNAVAFTGSYFYDLNFAHNIRVVHRGRVADSGTRYLSVCLGPWARVAGGVWIAAGRAVPGHALILQPPENVLLHIDEDLAGRRATTVRDSALVDAGPLTSNDPDYVVPPSARASAVGPDAAGEMSGGDEGITKPG